MVNAKCTSCGASINVDEKSDAGICPYYNSAYITEKAIKNVNNVTSNNAQVINNYYNSAPNTQQTNIGMQNQTRANDGKNVTRFLLILFLGCIGSFIINHSSLKPVGHTSRTMAYLFWGYFTCGIYTLVGAICNLSFNPNLPKNIGYIKEYM